MLEKYTGVRFVTHGEKEEFEALISKTLEEIKKTDGSVIDIKLSTNEGQYLALIIFSFIDIN